MSAFRAYGVSKISCRQQAERFVKTYDKLLKRELTMAEWLERVEEEASRRFATQRPRGISPRFDAPQFCRQWVELGGGNVKKVSIRAYKNVNEKNKALPPKYRWVPLDDAE